MDDATWNQIKKAQREATPQFSRQKCAQLTRIERKIFDGLEANVADCEGYSRFKAFSSWALGKISVGSRVKKTEAGGTRLVSWHERACNNPWLESPEYFELQDEFQKVGRDGAEEDIGPFQTEAQREAFLDGQIATSRTMSGAAILAIGAAIAEGAPEPVSAAGAGLAAYGTYRAITGVYDMLHATWTEFRESRGNE